MLSTGLSGQVVSEAANVTSAKDDPVVLSPFTITANTHGYRALNSITATGINADILDTPIAINVVTEEFLADTAAQELRQALNFVPGVRTAEDNESRFRVRGFTALAALRNGHFRRQLFPTWNIDRVEVIKGASAIFHGSNRPGGIINYITRKPTFAEFGEVKLLFGSDQRYRAEFDYTAPVGDKFAYRIGAGAYTAEGFRDFWHDRGNYIGSSLTFRPSERVEITLDYEHIFQNISDQQSTYLFVTNDQQDLARIYPSGDPEGFRYNLGGPDSFRDYTSSTVDLDVRVQLSQNFHYRLEANGAEDNFRVLRTQGTRENAGANAGTVAIRFGDFANYRDSWDIKNTVMGNFATGALQHTLMIGHQSNEVRQRTPGFGRKNGRQGPQFNYNPATGAFPQFPTMAPQYPLHGWELLEKIGNRTGDGPWNDNRRIKESSNAFYVIDSISLFADRLKLVGGARYNLLRQTLHWDSLPAVNPSDNIHQTRVTPQAGVLYKLNRHFSAFASYSESLEPQNALDADGNAAGPIEGRGYELGLKTDAFDGRVSGTISVFEVERSNTATRDTAREIREGRDPFYFFGNTETSRGLEADFVTSPVRNVQVLLSYAWMWTRETTAAQDPARIGTIFEQTPEHALNLWAKYIRTTGKWAGLEVGGGVRWDSGYLVSPLIETDASYRLDGLIRYPISIFGRKIAVSLNVNNLTNERNLGGSINWTNPREYFLTLRTKF
ncbi:MAG TPA: TonB-dependent receptor [Opitutus sp.]|nr:TonB-dependent receptor [Opitutus sp.]